MHAIVLRLEGKLVVRVALLQVSYQPLPLNAHQKAHLCIHHSTGISAEASAEQHLNHLHHIPSLTLTTLCTA